MGTAAVKIKIMPSSPESNLEKIKTQVSELIKKDCPNSHVSFKEELVAFGLKALIAMFSWPEEQDLEATQNKFENIEDVNSVQLIDIRRAIG